MADDKQEILEWYNDKPEGADEYVLIKKSEYERTSSSNNSTENPPMTSDLNPVPSDSPQVDIQQELINRAMGHEISQKNDALIATDKANAYKAYAVTELIEKKLKMFSALAGAHEEDPLRKEGIANDLKTLSRELADIIGAL